VRYPIKIKFWQKLNRFWKQLWKKTVEPPIPEIGLQNPGTRRTYAGERHAFGRGSLRFLKIAAKRYFFYLVVFSGWYYNGCTLAVLCKTVREIHAAFTAD
jgi:hypothetical protein